MDVVKALLVFFVLTGCAEVASELPLARSMTPPSEQSAPPGDASRLGPPNPHGSGARHVDQATATTPSLTIN
jgi:hypothetical protein